MKTPRFKMAKDGWRLGLGTKLSLMFSSLITATSITIIVYTYTSWHEALMREAHARYQSIANNFAFNAEYGVLTRNSQTLINIMRGLRQEPDVNFIKVSDRAGIDLAEMGQSATTNFRIDLPVHTRKVKNESEAGFLLEALDHGAGAGAEQEEIGHVTLEFDLTPVKERLSTIRLRAAILAIACILAGLFLARMIVRIMFAPLNRAVSALEEIAEGGGNLSKKIEVTSTDEVGGLAANFNRFTETLAAIVLAVRSTCDQVATSSEKLTSVSQSMASGARETSVQANAVSGAVEKVNTSIQSVAVSTEAMSQNLQEVSRNVNRASLVATAAVKEAEAANTLVAKLGNIGAEIGVIVRVINSVARQSNFLALNATIEAARAGQAGEGFAVVAQRVGELAGKTAQSTDDIRKKIEVIQTDTTDAAKAIERIAHIIKQINDIQMSIASAVDEQSQTTAEITANLSQAARSSSEITENVTTVAKAVQGTNSGAAETELAAAELAEMASRLQKIVGEFK